MCTRVWVHVPEEGSTEAHPASHTDGQYSTPSLRSFLERHQRYLEVKEFYVPCSNFLLLKKGNYKEKAGMEAYGCRWKLFLSRFWSKNGGNRVSPSDYKGNPLTCSELQYQKHFLIGMTTVMPKVYSAFTMC